MNAIEFLKNDHRTVKHLFHDFRQRSGSAPKKVAQKIFDELETHTSIEEEILYPAVQDLSDDRSLELVHEAYEEHRVAKLLIEELKAMTPVGPEFDVKIKVLMESVEHHIKEEEGTLFPWMEEKLTTVAIDDLGRQLSERKAALTRPSVVGETLHRARTMVTDALAAAAKSLGMKSTPSRPRSKKASSTHAISSPKKHVADLTARAKTAAKRRAKPTAKATTPKRATKRTAEPAATRSRTTHTRAARK